MCSLVLQQLLLLSLKDEAAAAADLVVAAGDDTVAAAAVDASVSPSLLPLRASSAVLISLLLPLLWGWVELVWLVMFCLILIKR